MGKAGEHLKIYNSLAHYPITKAQLAGCYGTLRRRLLTVLKSRKALVPLRSLSVRFVILLLKGLFIKMCAVTSSDWYFIWQLSDQSKNKCIKNCYFIPIRYHLKINQLQFGTCMWLYQLEEIIQFAMSNNNDNTFNGYLFLSLTSRWQSCLHFLRNRHYTIF